MDWMTVFWRKVKERDNERPIAPDGKIAVDPKTEDSIVIPDRNAHRPLPEPDDISD